ncbi:MAG: hypothetical protein RL347_343 [Actinomycetota bacterium]|jgi:hypothetical protein
MTNMVRRMSTPVVRRPSLPLTADDEERLSALKEDADMRRALMELVPDEPHLLENPSEGVLLHAVVEAGFAAIRRQRELSGYAELAETRVGTAKDRRHVARRRQPAWVDEP